jgi:NAD(P)-dependent dehydrogenase (short-subunit alcohol dehydrogenase family)
MRGLTDRVIVVAGAATGIGAATARRLGEEGAKVVVADFNLTGAEETAQSIEAAGNTAIALQYDQGDESSISKLIAATVEHFGGLYGLHANAVEGRKEITARDVEVIDMDVAVWERSLLVNLIGYATLIREALPHMLAARGGAIVCTSSDGSSFPMPNRPAYSVSKAGVNALIRHVAVRWGKEGIRANAVSPGTILTEAIKRNTTKELLEEWGTARPSPRAGEPADVAAMVAFLLSDDSEFVNGQVWGVDGGFHMRD